jgi:hypothetical protein
LVVAPLDRSVEVLKAESKVREATDGFVALPDDARLVGLDSLSHNSSNRSPNFLIRYRK